MKIVVVGSGGREHAIVKKLNEEGSRVFAFMKNRNPGIASLSEDFKIGDETDLVAVEGYVKAVNPDLVFVSPDPVLNTPLVDTLRREGFGVASPSRSAARIETSKEFMRNLMRDHNISGSVKYAVFDNPHEMKRWIKDLSAPFVVKPIGLTGGKGVKVMGSDFTTTEEGISIGSSIIKNDGRVLIEEKLVGEEFSLQAFCDGKSAYPMPLAQDYKRALEGDLGPNTGGMGSITDSNFMLPFIGRSSYDKAVSIVKDVVNAMHSDGYSFTGILYAQFMETARGPVVVEINARFADPEGINVLSVMKSSLSDTLFHISEGKINMKPEFEKRATVLKYVVPEGYGSNPKPGRLKIKTPYDDNRRIYYAAVNGSLQEVEMTSSRALALVGISGSIPESSSIVDSMISGISGNFYVRRDIGTEKSIISKINKMRKLRLPE